MEVVAASLPSISSELYNLNYVSQRVIAQPKPKPQVQPQSPPPPQPRPAAQAGSHTAPPAPKQETGKKWKEGSQEVFELRNLLLHEFRYAYRNDEYLLGRVNAIAGRQSYAALIQDLNDLSVLGKNNPAQLKAINFDLARLDTTAELAKEMAAILAAATAEAPALTAEI